MIASVRYKFRVWATKANIAFAGLLFFAIALLLRIGAESAATSASLSTISAQEEVPVGGLAKERFDESKLSGGHNYPVCQRLDVLYQDLMEEEAARSSAEDKYSALYENNSLHCGQERQYGSLWILGRKHNIRRPAQHCVPAIIDGKRRVLTWLSGLCAVQDKYNHYWRLQEERAAKFRGVSSPSASSSSSSWAGKTKSKARSNTTVLHVTSPYRNRRALEHNLKGNVDAASDSAGSLANSPSPRNVTAATTTTPTTLRLTKSSERQRGIIYTGLHSHFKDIYQSILAHRNLKVALPIEVWVDAADLQLCSKVFESPGAFEFLFPGEEPKSTAQAAKAGLTRCRVLPASASGFGSKFYALLGTPFTDVLFMDADNIAVRDVSTIFNSTAYKTTGAVMWPDLWGEACRHTSHRADNGYTGFQTSVLWQAHVGGLEWQNTRAYAQEAEAGQIAFDLTRHAGLLELGKRLIEDREFFKPSVNGDKDIFRLVHLMVQEPFTFVDSVPGYSTAHPGAGRDCLTHYFGAGGDAGAGNAIQADTSGAFDFYEESKTGQGQGQGQGHSSQSAGTGTDAGASARQTQAQQVQAESTETAARPRPAMGFMFSFGSFVGSLFGGGVPRRSESKGMARSLPELRSQGNDLASDKGALAATKPAASSDKSSLRGEESPSDVSLKSADSLDAAPPLKLNGLGLPAGQGWGAPVGTDPFFFHQLKNRDATAFRFAYRLAQDTQNTPSVCFDFQAPKSLEGDQTMVTYKHPSADRLSVFATKLFLQVDWKWTSDTHNSWAWDAYWHAWRRYVASYGVSFAQLLILPALLAVVGVLLVFQNWAAGKASSAANEKST